LRTNQRIQNNPRKALGQNYLTDENICRNIVDSFEVKPDDIIVELGAGQGAITKYIIQHTNNLTVVEIDNTNCKILKENFHGLRILNEDILDISFSDIVNEFNTNKKLRVIGNIPYNITSPILFKLIENRQYIQDAQIMIQEEVARRLTAKPNTKDYGILSVFMQVYSKPRLLFKVSSNCFYPKPKVDSRIISLVFTDELTKQIPDEFFFRRFVRAAFSTRRKTLRNSLKHIDINVNELGVDFDFNRRAESLDVNEFISLSSSTYSALHKA
jgi:16S rRNA (adenine1518-N6/adenine1519-N6)-dimethyltransferase